MKNERSVVGIAAASSPDGETVVSICDDGSVWYLQTWLRWEELPPVPGTQRSRDLAKEQG